MPSRATAPTDQITQSQTKQPQTVQPHLKSEHQGVFADNRPEAASQRQLQTQVNNSPKMANGRTLQTKLGNRPQTLQSQAVQRVVNANEAMQPQGMLHGLVQEGGNFTLSYLQGVLAEHGLTSISDTLLSACSYLITQKITDSLASYAAVMTPYLGILRNAKTALSALKAIPAAVSTALAFGVGWCISSFSKHTLKGYFTETMIHGILMGASHFIDGLDQVITLLNDSINAPASLVYKGVHGVLSTMFSYFSGSATKTTNPPPEKSAGDSTAPKVPTEAAEHSDQSAPMIDTKLGFMWARVGQPTLASWNAESQERAGMEMHGGFGVNLFGHKMAMDGMQFRVPYGGDWRLNFTGQYELASSIELAGVFTVGSVVASDISINQAGLQSVEINILDIQVGNGVLNHGNLKMRYARGSKELDFAGTADLDVMKHVINGSFGLVMGVDGSLKRGGLEVTSLSSFSLLDKKLMLTNPTLAASFAPGVADIVITSDAELAIYKGIKATGEALRIAYEGGELSGSIAKLSVGIPINPHIKVQFELINGRVDEHGFTAAKALMRFAYTDKLSEASESDEAGAKPGEQPAIHSADPGALLPGFDMSWIKAAGIKTLKAEASASTISLNHHGLVAASTEKRISHFAAHLFGVQAEFNADEGSGTIAGQTPTKEIGANVHIPFPIIPGINGYIEMSAKLGFSAGLKGSATKKPPKQGNIMPWRLQVAADAKAEGELGMGIGAALGLGPLASIKGELYGALTPTLKGNASITGMLMFDEASASIVAGKSADQAPHGHYVLMAELRASVSARLRAQALFVFQRTLYEVRFKEWQIGKYQVAGEFTSSQEGDLVLGKEKNTFNGKDRPAAPEVDKMEISSLTFLQQLKAKPSIKVSDKLLVSRVLHDMFEPTAGLSEQEQLMYLPILEHAVEGDARSVTLDHIMETIGQRNNAENHQGKKQQSHFMATQEWLEYSTTTGLRGGVNKRRSIQPIDAEVMAYSRAASQDYAGRIKIIKKIIDLSASYGGSRSKMVLRLKYGALRELDMLEKLQEEK